VTGLQTGHLPYADFGRIPKIDLTTSIHFHPPRVLPALAGVLGLIATARLIAVLAQTDPLPSWNDGTAKRGQCQNKILERSLVVA
jgi:hypothetical protein